MLGVCSQTFHSDLQSRSRMTFCLYIMCSGAFTWCHGCLWHIAHDLSHTKACLGLNWSVTAPDSLQSINFPEPLRLLMVHLLIWHLQCLWNIPLRCVCGWGGSGGTTTGGGVRAAKEILVHPSYTTSRHVCKEVALPGWSEADFAVILLIATCSIYAIEF